MQPSQLEAADAAVRQILDLLERQTSWTRKHLACFAAMLREEPYQGRREVVDLFDEVQAVVASSLTHRMMEQS